MYKKARVNQPNAAYLALARASTYTMRAQSRSIIAKSFSLKRRKRAALLNSDETSCGILAVAVMRVLFLGGYSFLISAKNSCGRGVIIQLEIAIRELLP